MGNDSDLFADIKKAVEDAQMPVELAMKLILTGIITLNSEVTEVKGQIDRLLPAYRILAGIGTILMGLVATTIWGVVTGQINIIIK